MTKRKYWPWEEPMAKPKIHRRNGKLDLARMYDDGDVARRKRLNDDDLWLDLMEEFREAARLRTTLYQQELAKEHPRVAFLIRLWGENFEDYEMASWATPPGPTKDAFEEEMALSDEAIDRLSAPLLKRMLP
jgi:hypothetical protein